MQYNIRPLFAFGLLWFIRKFAAATKNLKANYTFFVKPTCLFINSRNKKINDKFLTLTKLTLTILDKY